MNFGLFCDMNLFIFLSCLLLMLKIIYVRITFVHKWNIFICDYVITIKTWLNTFTTKCMHLKWKVISLYFNISSVEYFYFNSMDFTFWATCLMHMVRRSMCPKRLSLVLLMMQNHLAWVCKVIVFCFHPWMFFQFCTLELSLCPFVGW